MNQNLIGIKEMASMLNLLFGKQATWKVFYGSISVRDTILALSAQGSPLKRMVLLKEPINEIGSYKVPIRVYKGANPIKKGKKQEGEINLNESKSYWYQKNGFNVGCAGILALFQNQNK